MRPRRRLFVLAAALLVAGAAALVVWRRVIPAAREREAARAFGAFAVCMTGAPRATPDDAPVRARRIHHEGPPRDGWAPAPCLEEVRALDTPGIRAVEPRLASEAQSAAITLEGHRVPGNLADLFRAAEHLRWVPPPGVSVAVPEPLLDTSIPRIRALFPHAINLRQELDTHPPDSVALRVRDRRLVVTADASGAPLARASWAPHPPRNGQIHKTSGDPTIVRLEGRELSIHDGRVEHGAASNGPRLPGKSPTYPSGLDLPISAKDLRITSCRAPAGHLLALDSKGMVHVLFVRDDGVDLWGSTPRAEVEPPASTGRVSIACDEASARITWSMTEGMGHPKSGMGGDYDTPPLDQWGHHRIITARCTPSGCARREVIVKDISTGWMGTGGWSSAWIRVNPDVFDLGERLLVLWKDGLAIRARLAAPDRLEGAPDLFIAEYVRPETGSPDNPRAIAWPSWQVLPRGDAALVLIQESGPSSTASFLLRFDAKGQARVIEPDD